MIRNKAFKKEYNRNTLIASIALLSMLCVIVGCLIVYTSSKRIDERQQGVTTAVETDDVDSSDSAEDEKPEIVFFASDYQEEPGFDSPANNLRKILTAISSDDKALGRAVICGDYTNDSKLYDYQLSPEDSIAAIKDVLCEKCPSIKTEETIFVQGNHDKLTDSISASGLHEYDKYLVYVLNTENDFPWRQGQVSGCHAKVIAAAENMKNCFDNLITKGENRPVFIAGHVPLHYTARTSSKHTTGDNLYSSIIFDVVNEAALSLDIVYMFGHNHSKGWDCYMGGSSVCRTVGEKLLIPIFNNSDVNTDRFEARDLNFTYMNAGYLGYYMNCGLPELEDGSWHEYDAADMTLSGTICEIYSDELIITRYTAEGIHPLAWEGMGNPYKGGIDEKLIGSEHYSSRKESPIHIKRKSEEDIRRAAEEKAAAENGAASHVYSHRGSAGSYEHTFAAYDEAIAAGSKYIEQDVVLSSDGVLFASHDLSASKMTGVNKNYYQMSADEIDELETNHGEKIHRLSEIFDKYKDAINYVIEIKSLDSATIQAFEDIVDKYGYKDIIIAQSTEAWALEELEQKYPDMPKLLICKTQDDFDTALDLPHADILSVRVASGLMTEDNCMAAHERGKVFSAWTLDTESDIKSAIDIGVDTYFTNDTALAISIEKGYGNEVRE